MIPFQMPQQGLDVSHIIEWITDYQRQNLSIRRLMSQIESLGELVLIGGAVRDLCSKVKTPRDLDIVVNCPSTTLRDLLSNQLEPISVNRFGGYKIQTKEIEIDLWALEDTWAFKKRITQPLIKNLTHSAFFNIDGIYYNISTGEADLDNFSETLTSGILDINIDKKYAYINPNPEINIARAIKLMEIWHLFLSPTLVDYIYEWLLDATNPIEQLETAHLRHYRNNDFNKEFTRHLLYREFGFSV